LSRVLIISNDYVSQKMAGPAIRCWELANALSRKHNVTLACENQPDIWPEEFTLVPFNREREALARLAEANDVIVIPPYTLAIYPLLKRVGKPLVMDMYDPFILEKLEVYSAGETASEFETDLGVLKDQLLFGDFFLAGTEEQRCFWLGMLAALGRINPATYAFDKSLEALVCVVPFGVPAKPPQHTKQSLRGVVKGIGSDDFVLIWAGGIWNWFDPFTLIAAIKKASAVDPTIKLFFLGTKHPHPAMPKAQFRVANEAFDLAKKLGILGRSCFFNRDWVPYHERQNFLLEADVGVSTHFDHIENHFAIRTRTLDYIWAGLPIIITEGDYISRLVRQRGLGITVPPQDADALAEGILKLRQDSRTRLPEYKKALAQLASELRWDRIVKPLDEFCQRPHLAADRSESRPESGGQRRPGRSLAQKLRDLVKEYLVH